MKKLTYLFSAWLAVTMISCGGQKKEIDTFAKTFAGYTQTNQLDSVNSVYPTANFDSINPLSVDSISIEEIEGAYKINYGSDKWVTVSGGDNGKITVLKSKGLAALPSDKYEVAVLTGMITDSTDDVESVELLKDSRYFSWLPQYVSENLLSLSAGKPVQRWGVDLKGRMCEAGVCSVTCTVKNNSSKPIKGSDYSIRFSTMAQTCSDGSSPDIKVWHNKDGVDLAPGASADLKLAGMDYKLSDISYYFTLPVDELIKNYFTPTGNEYKVYIDKLGKPSPEDLSENSKYDWLSEREVSPIDLQGKSKEELRIMRNWIYARHGYIFKSKDLSDYFSGFPWYEPQSSDVTSSLNKTEKTNIQTIKSYE